MTLYVVELDTPEGPAVYVGSTALRPAERFAQHKAGGGKSNGRVRHYGVRLLEVPVQLRRIHRDDSWAVEDAAMRELRAEGVRVYGFSRQGG